MSPYMRINRAVGLIMFLVVARFIMGDIFISGSRAAVATFGALESASVAATARFNEQR